MCIRDRHYTLDLNSGGRFGPDTEWVQNEDYSLNEARTRLAFLEIRKYWPKCDLDRLRPVYAGIRPKIGAKKDFQKDYSSQKKVCSQIEKEKIELENTLKVLEASVDDLDTRIKPLIKEKTKADEIIRNLNLEIEESSSDRAFLNFL